MKGIGQDPRFPQRSAIVSPEKIDAVCLRIYSYGARAAFGLDGINGVLFSSKVLDDRQRSLAIGTERETSARVIFGRLSPSSSRSLAEADNSPVRG